MCMIEKRDGRKVPFRREKITNAVLKSINNSPDISSNIDEIEKQNIADTVADSIDASSQKLSVEDIQDQVVSKLKELGYKDISKAYNNYRKQRTLIREKNSAFMVEAEEKLMATNVQNQNANVDEYSFGGRKGEADSVLMKHIALNHLMSAKSRNNHVNNRIYIHDLDSYVVGMHNCLSVPFDDLLGKGFNTRQTDVRPANSVNTAFQLVAVLFQIQSLQQFGGVSATHLDWTMVPYVRKSFLKHYIISWLTDSEEFENLDLEAMLFDDYDERIEDNGTTFIIHRNKFEDWVDENKAAFFEKTGLTKEDFYLGNDKLDRKHYQRAYFDTINETQQAAEGFFHNMNSLQSRSGN